MSDFDPAAEVAALKAESQLRRKRSYKQRQSKLDRFHSELAAMRQHGATVVELQRWLRKKKRITVAESTVHRWLKSKGIDGEI